MSASWAVQRSSVYHVRDGWRRWCWYVSVEGVPVRGRAWTERGAAWAVRRRLGGEKQ